MRASAISAITLARSGVIEYQVTYWHDGVARFDGQSGHRQGAWDAQADPAWFTQLRKFARNVQSGHLRTGEAAVTVIVDVDGSRLTFEAAEGNEPADLWTLATLVDGMSQQTRWAPLDTSGTEDLAAFGEGVPVWLSLGGVMATGYGLPGAILVLAGAQVSTSTAPSLDTAYQERRAQYIDDGSLVLENDSARLAPTPVIRVALRSGQRARRLKHKRPAGMARSARACLVRAGSGLDSDRTRTQAGVDPLRNGADTTAAHLAANASRPRALRRDCYLTIRS